MPATCTQATLIASLEASIAADHEFLLPQEVLYDVLQEEGVKPQTAKRRTNALVRASREAAELRTAAALVAAETAKGARRRSAIRDAAGVGGSQAPIEVVAGDAAPSSEGESGYHVFRGTGKSAGGRCQFPGAARNAGYKTDYIQFTVAVTVGAGWVLKNC